MNNKVRVMQITETGEEFCIDEFKNEELAQDWIDDNKENYPESTFYIEDI